MGDESAKNEGKRLIKAKNSWRINVRTAQPCQEELLKPFHLQ